MAGIAASAGPLLGGLLVTTVGWRWVFLIYLPVGALCLAMTVRHARRSPRCGDRPLDWTAQCAIVLAVVLLTAALNEAGRRGWSDPAVLAAAGLAVLAAGGFALRERMARVPVLPLGLLRSRAMSGGAVIGALFNFAFYGMVFTASVYFQHERGFSALGAGAALFPAVAMTMFASVSSGRLARRTGHRPLVIAGMLVAALGPACWAAAGPEPAYALLVAPHDGCGFRDVLCSHGGHGHRDGRSFRGLFGNGVGPVQHHAPGGQRHRCGPGRNPAGNRDGLRRRGEDRHGHRSPRVPDRRVPRVAVRAGETRGSVSRAPATCARTPEAVASGRCVAASSRSWMEGTWRVRRGSTDAGPRACSSRGVRERTPPASTSTTQGACLPARHSGASTDQISSS